MITPSSSISPPDSPEDLNIKSTHHNHHHNHHTQPTRAQNQHPSFSIDHILSRDSSPIAQTPPTSQAQAANSAAVAAAAAAAAMLSPGNEAALLQHAAAARLQSHMFHQTMMNHQSSSAAAMAAAAAAQQHLMNVHHHQQQQQHQHQQQQQHHHNPYAGQLGPQFAHLSAGLHRLLHLHPYRKPKRIRTAFSPGQLIELEHAFEKNHYVVGTERKQLAQRLNLTETQVKVWFQNRRTKHKRQKSDD